ncbi:hypothetical protein D3C75_1037170 [compost metagenome]
MSIYIHNNTYIDVRTPNDEKRGLITLIAGSAGTALICMLAIGLYYSGGDYLLLLMYNEKRLDTLDYLFT